MNSFLRCFLNWFMAAIGTAFFTASASTLFANDGLDKNCYRKTNSKRNKFPTSGYRVG